MSVIKGFPPIAADGVRVLILGSMPSVASLAQRQYYAHPRNQFWSIMGVLFGAGLDKSYATRCQKLLDNHIALWDVTARCQRDGSLDSSIVEDTIITNDLLSFFGRYPTIRRVCFNGGKAKQVYNKYVLQTMPTTLKIDYLQLPSTSPAHAALSLEDKIKVWRQVKKWVMR